MSKWLWNHEPQTSGFTVNFGNVLPQFIINKRTNAQKTDVNLFFMTTKPENGEMPKLNKGKYAVNLP